MCDDAGQSHLYTIRWGADWGARNIPSDARDDDVVVVDVRRAGASRCGGAGDDDDDACSGDARASRASGGASRCGGDAVADAIHGGLGV